MLTPEAYSAISRRPMDFSDYIDVIRRNRGWILGPIFAGIVIGAVVALVLPNIYVSQASLRIAPAADLGHHSAVDREPADVGPHQRDAAGYPQPRERCPSSSSDRDSIFIKRSANGSRSTTCLENMRTKDVHIQVVRLPGRRNGRLLLSRFLSRTRTATKRRHVVSALVARFMESNLSGQRVAGTVTRISSTTR